MYSASVVQRLALAAQTLTFGLGHTPDFLAIGAGIINRLAKRPVNAFLGVLFTNRHNQTATQPVTAAAVQHWRRDQRYSATGAPPSETH
ncbi:hypothetical protein FBUS_00979 [Fasciolopsis buskii]|uniref:Uncharacterized protein n=1 Tax=Fasciolopsis buskii TaxID=27845 RepID=A0A8E0RZU6_9TREM|nr:hypothetical protein FBUS_00979 [Fasciolopsis buski]